MSINVASLEKHAKGKSAQMKRKWEYNGPVSSTCFFPFNVFLPLSLSHLVALSALCKRTDTRHTIHAVEIWHWHWMAKIVGILSTIFFTLFMRHKNLKSGKRSARKLCNITPFFESSFKCSRIIFTCKNGVHKIDSDEESHFSEYYGTLERAFCWRCIRQRVFCHDYICYNMLNNFANIKNINYTLTQSLC